MKRRIPRLEGDARSVGKGELIGLDVCIACAHDAGIQGLQGQVVDESLHTLTIRVGGPGGRRIRVPKVGCVFAFSRTGRDPVEVEGAALEFRSEDRVKKVR